jgi:hypothetical protein
MYGVHKRLLTLNYTLFLGERQLLLVLWGLPGAALTRSVLNDI